MSSTPSSTSGLTFLLILNGLISAGTYLVAKWALFELTPMELSLARFTVASAGYLALLRRPSGRPSRRDLVGLSILGFATVAVFQWFFLTGLSWSSSGHAALLFALTPVFVAVSARLRLGEPLRPAKVGGIALAFAGVVLVLASRGLVSATLAERKALWGDLLILVAVLCWTSYIVIGKPYAERLGAVSATGWSTLAGTLLFLPIALPQVRWEHYRALSWSGWAAVAYLGIAASILSYVINYWALARVDTSRVAIWSNLQPVLTALLSWAIYGERLTPAFLLGGAMVIGGVVVTQRVRDGAATAVEAGS